MDRLPIFTLDLVAAGLLPDGWDREIAALTDTSGCEIIIPSDVSPLPECETWSMALVAGDILRDRCPWLLPLYLGPMLEFAARSFGRPLFVDKRLRSAMSLHILSGEGARIDWHAHAGMVNGLLFVTPPDEAKGGDLVFRDAGGREERPAGKAGTFVCFDGAIDHCVTPLRSPGPRLTVPLIYFASADSQQPAYDVDVYLDSGG